MARRRRRARNEGSIYQTGRTWAVKWREGGKRRTRGGFESREAAAAVLARITSNVRASERDLDLGRPPPLASFPTLAEEAQRWLARRDHTHRAAYDDRLRWTKHLAPEVGHLRPPEVDAGIIRRLIERKLAEGYNPSTVGHFVRLLSTFFSDLCERPRETGVTTNPVRTVPRSTRRLVRPTHDPASTPFLESLDDVRRVYAVLPEPVQYGFAVGALAGLRTGEVLGLEWGDVDLDRRRMVVRRQVQESKAGPLKDDTPRVVPVLDSLAPILTAWKLKSGGTWLVVPPVKPRGGHRRKRDGTPGAAPTFMRPQTLHRHLRAALTACALPQVTWYQATRHTFASQWVMGNGSIEKLAAVLGHSSAEVTKHYAHLRPDLFRPDDFARLPVDLARAPAEVVSLPAGPSVVHEPSTSAAQEAGIG